MTAIQPYTWKERLRDSSWVTVAWDWFMTLLGRVVEGALWVTMVFSCYQLIPGAPQPASVIGDMMFIIQFVSLDIGGIGLNKLAQSQGLDRWSYPRIIAYVLIGLTLVTVAYAGLQHVVTAIPSQVTSGIEVSLVVARSVMTVFYGQAIHSLKHELRTKETTLIELEQELSTLHVQLDSKAQEVDMLTERLRRASDEVSSLRQALDAKEQEVSSLAVQVSSLRVHLGTGHGQVEAGQQTPDTRHLDSERASAGERLIVLDRRRATRSKPSASAKDEHQQQEALVQQIRELLDHEPGLSGRAIATRVGCSPTTASKWKAQVEQEHQQGIRRAGH